MVLAAACVRPVHMASAPEDGIGCRAPVSDTVAPRLAWIRPDEEHERRILDERCAQVGPPLIVQGASRGDVPVTRLVIVTWNLHDGRGDILRLIRDLGSGRHGAPAPDATVLLLQEFVRPGPVTPGRDVPALVASLGWHLAYVPARRTRARPGDSTFADRGTAILSSLPLSDLQAIELPVERQRRLALAATVRGATMSSRPWQLRVISAHLENRPGRRRWWLRAGAARTRQTEALLAALRLPAVAGDRAPDDALVLGGDFNTWLGGREQALRLLHDAFPRWSGEDTRPTIGLRRRLDHLFASLPPGVIAVHRRMDDRYGSDHHPVVAAIDFGAN
jgi:endonuclease/exonuclease/phosphatase family metal-dependent hydrolase